MSRTTAKAWYVEGFVGRKAGRQVDRSLGRHVESYAGKNAGKDV